MTKVLVFDVNELVDQVHSVEEVRRYKPAPEPYRTAASRRVDEPAR